MKEFEKNKYGNIDIRKGLPKGSTHIPRVEYAPIRIKNVCDNLEVAYAEAFIGFEPSWKYYRPVIDGIIVWSRCRKKVLDEVERRKSEARKKPAQSKPRDYGKQFNKKYDCKRDALLDAANAMFNLNRFCRHRRCTESERNLIYGVKNDFVRYLYREGFSTDVGIRRLERSALICWECDGEGCERCDFSGEYMPSDYIDFVIFYFNVDGVPYCWHQPRCDISYDIELTLTQAPMPYIPVMDLEIETKRFQKKKSIALVEWVMEDGSKSTEGK